MNTIANQVEEITTLTGNKIRRNDHLYYEDCFGFKHDGTVFWVKNTGDFCITEMPNTRMPQMDDSRRILNIKDENKLFWFYPVPEHPISIELQMKNQRSKS